jgi:hypothetical protein
MPWRGSSPPPGTVLTPSATLFSPRPLPNLPQARLEQAALKRHDELMTEKLEAIRKAPPPDYTITGGWGAGGVGRCAG